MNQKKPYKSDKPAPTYLYEVKVNGHRLIKGMECTLPKAPGWRSGGEWQFQYGEQLPNGTLLLTFFGPVKAKGQRMRQISADQVKTVRLRTRALAEHMQSEAG